MDEKNFYEMFMKAQNMIKSGNVPPEIQKMMKNGNIPSEMQNMMKNGNIPSEMQNMMKNSNLSQGFDSIKNSDINSNDHNISSEHNGSHISSNIKSTGNNNSNISNNGYSNHSSNSSNNSSSNSNTNNGRYSNSSSSSGSGSGNINNINNGSLDINTMMNIQKMMSMLNSKSDDDLTNLLFALKPYLRNQKKEKIDEYVKLFRMGKMAELWNKMNSQK